MSAVPMIGRSAEFGQAERFLDDLPCGSRCLLLEGEVGIGKSTLLNEARASATDRGYRVLSASPIESEVPLEFAAFADLFEIVPESG
ncbi:MAG: regulatory protein LuxR [Acidimicrobiaceae bacterium]|nr:regulatory protein LuxR [Acidimicrobiaceae bacterium]